MKKLLMAMAIVLAAVAAQATEVYIKLDDVRSAVTHDYISANGYFIYSDTLSQSDAVAAFYSAGASYESTLASSAALALQGSIDDGFWGSGSTQVSRISDGMYALCFDQDDNNYYMYVSPVAAYDGNDIIMGKLYNIYDAADSSRAAARSASDEYQGAGWYSVASTSPVPEPTSGLLMLLGVAGLALKRKRA